jgi:hypothetical protein
MPVTISALTWNNGSPPSAASPAASPAASAMPRPQASWLAWVCAAIFGAPVVPAGVHERGEIPRLGKVARQVAGLLPGD